jgi:hypothetical protein
MRISLNSFCSYDYGYALKARSGKEAGIASGFAGNDDHAAT